MAPFNITVHPGQVVPVVEASGPAALPALSLHGLPGRAGAQQALPQGLMNLLPVDIQFFFTDHLALGTHAAQALHELERVASVVNEKHRSGTSEKAAQKSGLRLRTFTVLEDGIAWVLSGALTPAP